MSAQRRDDIYFCFRKYRFMGFTYMGACTAAADEMRTRERTVRMIAIQHGEYAP